LRSIIRPARPTGVVNRLGLYCPIHDPVLVHPAPATTVAGRRGIHGKIKPRAYGTFVTFPLARCQIRAVRKRAAVITITGGIAFLQSNVSMPLKWLSIWSYCPTAVIRVGRGRGCGDSRARRDRSLVVVVVVVVVVCVIPPLRSPQFLVIRTHTHTLHKTVETHIHYFKSPLHTVQTPFARTHINPHITHTHTHTRTEPRQRAKTSSSLLMCFLFNLSGPLIPLACPLLLVAPRSVIALPCSVNQISFHSMHQMSFHDNLRCSLGLFESVRNRAFFLRAHAGAYTSRETWVR